MTANAVKSKVRLLRLTFKKLNTSIVLGKFSPYHHQLTFSVGATFSSYLPKKNMKRSRKYKLLLMRLIRKLLLLLNMYDITLLVKKAPHDLPLLILSLTKPLTHTYTNPFTQKIHNESLTTLNTIKLWGVTFQKTLNFAALKGRKRGKVKRKVYRKLIYRNNVVD
jgi:hypothetical protein